MTHIVDVLEVPKVQSLLNIYQSHVITFRHGDRRLYQTFVRVKGKTFTLPSFLILNL